jgi:hypothetical protein
MGGKFKIKFYLYLHDIPAYVGIHHLHTNRKDFAKLDELPSSNHSLAYERIA